MKKVSPPKQAYNVTEFVKQTSFQDDKVLGCKQIENWEKNKNNNKRKQLAKIWFNRFAFAWKSVATHVQFQHFRPITINIFNGMINRFLVSTEEEEERNFVSDKPHANRRSIRKKKLK